MENTHIKIQYHNEELTVQEICERLEMAEQERDAAVEDLRRLVPAWKWDKMEG